MLSSSGREAKWNILGITDVRYCKRLLSYPVVYALAGSEHGVFSAGGDETIRSWRLPQLEHIGTMRGHKGSVLALKLVDNDTLFSGTLGAMSLTMQGPRTRQFDAGMSSPVDAEAF